jgi:predicted CXXCH cytochrome family protein
MGLRIRKRKKKREKENNLWRFFGMGKVKWSFSLFLAILLVGILSTAAFASVMYTLQAVQNGLDLEVSFTGKTDDVGKKFDLVVKNGSTTVDTYYGVTIDGTSKIGTFQIPLSKIPTGPSGPVYTAELYSDNNGSITGSSLARLIIDQPNNDKLYHGSNQVDEVGSGLVNANHTGADVKRKSGQSVHGFYQNNTNSCASCHQTHTAQDGNLLLKNGVYSTCSSCHDGTTGAYNSFSPTKSTASDGIAGTFDVSEDAHGSLHQADGSLKITAAPGGNSDSNSKIWNRNFDCASCHAPHGSGSADENNLNLDPLGWGGVQYYPVGATKADKTKATKDDANGKLFKDITIKPISYFISDDPTIPDKVWKTYIPNSPYILVTTKATDTDLGADGNYFWKRAGVTKDSDIIQTYRWDGTSYVPDYSLWLQEKGYPFKADTVLADSTGKDITRDANVHAVWIDGFAWGSGVANIKSAQISLGIDVETTENVKSLYDSSFSGKDSKGNPISYIPDSGVEMTKYCTACHTDYMIDPESGKEAGALTGYHRHTTTVDETGAVIIRGVSDELTCVRCHFAHGTKADLMKDRNGIKAITTDTLSDINHSSALRRYIDMDSCYTKGCHNSDNSVPSMYLEWSF